jgi:hypothetical protein
MVHCFPQHEGMRYDKLAENSLAMVQFVSIRLWLRVYECAA